MTVIVADVLRRCGLPVAYYDGVVDWSSSEFYLSLSLIVVGRIHLLRSMRKFRLFCSIWVIPFGLSCFHSSSFPIKHFYCEVIFSNVSSFVTVVSNVALSFSFSFDNVYYFVHLYAGIQVFVNCVTEIKTSWPLRPSIWKRESNTSHDYTYRPQQ